MSDAAATWVRCLLALCLALSGTVAVVAGVPAPVSADRTVSATAQDDSGGNTTDQNITTTPRFSRVQYSGSGVVTVARNRTYVWQTGNTSLEAVVKPIGNQGPHELCLTLRGGNGTDRTYGCRTIQVQSYGGTTAFAISDFGNATGNRTLQLDYRRADGSGGNETARVPVTVMTPDGDVDGDNLPNEKELEHNTSLLDGDTDTDGLLDGREVIEYNSSATEADTDDDGARDGMEIEAGSDPSDPDTDNDGLTDGEELTQHNTDPTKKDTDEDGLSDRAEVQDYDTDPAKKDTDGDGLTDYAEVKKYGTDPMKKDTDGDGLTDGEEVERGLDPREPSGAGQGTSEFLDRNTLLFAGLGLALAVGGFAAYLTLDNRNRGSSGESEVPPPASAAGPGDGAPGDAAGSEAMAGGTAGAAGASADPIPDPDLLSPEEYIRQLLEANGGYMKQSDVVDQVEWSKATVSRRLSSMEEDGLIERTRMGRGKIVTLPDIDLDETP